MSGCATENYSVCPAWPKAGPEVAQELEAVSFSKAPHFWDWMGRMEKLERKLELCKR